MQWKIKVKAAPLGVLKRKVFLTHPSRSPIEIGDAYVDRRSGWSGGGQDWTFESTENPLDLHLSNSKGRSKKELLSQLHELLEKSNNEIIRKHS